MASRRARIPTRSQRAAATPRFPIKAERAFEAGFRQLAKGFAAYVARNIIPQASNFTDRTDAKGAKSNPQAKTAGKKMQAAADQSFSAKNVSRLADKAVNQIVTNSKDEFKRLRINPKKEPGLKPLVDGWTRDLAESVKGMTADQVGKLEAILAEGNGRHASSIAKDIEARLGIVANRAAFIARNAVSKLNGKITRERFRNAGIDDYIWTTQDDDRVRPAHADLDGELFDVDGEGDPDCGHPGDQENCLTGDSRITRLDHVLRFYRYRYSGQLTTLVTDTGETFNATPNHPVLTNRGWLPAKSIDVGDYAFGVGQQVVQTSEQHSDKVNPAFADLFDAALLIGIRRTVRGTALQFHGDGVANEQVDIIEFDDGLLAHTEPALTKKLGKFVLADTLVRADSFAEARTFEFALRAIGLPASRSLCSLADRFARLNARISKSSEVRSAATATTDAVTIQHVRDRLALDVVAFREALDRGALSVEIEAFVLRVGVSVLRSSVVAKRPYTTSAECLGEIVRVATESCRDLTEQHPLFKHPLRIVEKRSREFSGHVFNLESASGWYGASLLNSNCRCVQYPIKKDAPADDDADEDDDADDDD